MTKPTVFLNTARIEEGCPVLGGQALAEFRQAARSANAFSDAVLRWLDAKDSKAQAAWLKTGVNLSRDLLQPWTIETLFLLSVVGPLRFTQLQQMMGVSSRTLSDRLKFLKRAGLVDRTVYDEHPVRIEYAPTPTGRKTASLAAPLMAHLGLETLKVAGQI